MDWLRRLGRTSHPVDAAPDEESPWPLDGAAPGVAALLEAVAEDQSHSVLDLGQASKSSLEVYGRFGRRVRFAGVLEIVRASEGWSSVLDALPPQPRQPYDLIFAWDVMDRLRPEDRVRLVDRLVQLSAPDARLHVIVAASSEAIAQPFRFTLLDVDRIRYEPVGPKRSVGKPLLPAEVERLLAPFEVVRAVTLKGGLREYVAVRRER